MHDVSDLLMAAALGGQYCGRGRFRQAVAAGEFHRDPVRTTRENA
jgi:hypothetical protein